MTEEKFATISEESLQALVHAFYAKVRQDPLIGPVFNGAIANWDEHLNKLQAFWSSVMLGSGRYQGRPMPAHIKHAHVISRLSFQRWLLLWGETTDAYSIRRPRSDAGKGGPDRRESQPGIEFMSIGPRLCDWRSVTAIRTRLALIAFQPGHYFA